MTLNKRYLRNIKENLSFYIASSVLTVVALLLFYLFYIAGSGIKKYGDEFFEKYNLEDATFTTYLEIPDEKNSDIENKYNVIFEKEHFDGEDVSKDDEIVISKGYAVSQNIKIGDKVKIKGNEYTVTGKFLRPDYLYMLENSCYCQKKN